MVASRSEVEPDDEIAFDLAVELSAIAMAVRFEELLREGAGLPARPEAVHSNSRTFGCCGTSCWVSVFRLRWDGIAAIDDPDLADQ